MNQPNMVNANNMNVTQINYISYQPQVYYPVPYFQMQPQATAYPVQGQPVYMQQNYNQQTPP